MTIATDNSDQHLEREKGSEERTTDTSDSGDDTNDELLQVRIN